MATGSRRLSTYASNLRAAFADLLSQEFSASTGHLAALLNGCAFAPSLLTFWFVNGLIDFSTAFLIGTIASPAGLEVRLLAYLLLVPVFVLARAGYYLLHPTHRRTLLSGACPQGRLFSLDWFSVGILATGLPLALQDLGPWVGMNLVFLAGVFVLPRYLRRHRAAVAVKVGSIVAGSVLFLYANYGGELAGILPVLPHPAAVLGPVATFRLSDATTAVLLRGMNSFLLGPLAVGAFAAGMNRLLTRPELATLPIVRHTLPRRDPDRVVLASSILGTVFYLSVAAVALGRVVVVP